MAGQELRVDEGSAEFHTEDRPNPQDSTWRDNLSSMWLELEEGGEAVTKRFSNSLVTDLERRFTVAGRSRLPLPETIGPYRIERLLGSGGMGAVYLGVHESDGTAAAVKVALQDDLREELALEREADCLKQIDHPSIPKVLGQGRDVHGGWLATEFVQGTTLDQAVIAGSWSSDLAQVTEAEHTEVTTRQLMMWFRDLANAIAALSDAELIHRDIKPTNIMVDYQGHAALIDFGLAVEDLDFVNGLEGTLAFMSPEQVLYGPKNLTSASDVYSLAATFHWALTGKIAARGSSDSETVSRIAVRRLEPPSTLASDCPSTVDPIFVKAMDKDLRERYASPRELAEDIDQWLKGASLIHATEPLRMRLQRHWKPIALCLAVALMVVGYFSFEAIQRSSAMNGVLEEVSTLSAKGRYREALKVLHGSASSYGDIPAYQHRYEVVASAAGEGLSRQMLRSLAFANPLSSRGTRYEAIAREAQTHTEFCKHPSFVFQLAMFEYLDGHFAKGLAVLDANAEIANQSSSLLDLRFLLQIERGDWEGASETLEQLRDTPPESSDTATCLRALRLFKVWDCARSSVTGLSASPEMLEEGQKLVQTVLTRDAQHMMARALKGQFQCFRKYFEESLETFEQLRRDADEGDEANITVWCARVAVMSAAGTGNEKYRLAAERYAQHLIDEDPRLISLVTRWVLFRMEQYKVGEPGAIWSQIVMNPAKPGLRDKSLQAEQVAAVAAYRLGVAGKQAELDALFELVSQLESPSDPAAVKQRKSIVTTGYWWSYRDLHGAFINRKNTDDLASKRARFNRYRESLGASDDPVVQLAALVSAGIEAIVDPKAIDDEERASLKQQLLRASQASDARSDWIDPVLKEM